jgi:hypothetical protein
VRTAAANGLAELKPPTDRCRSARRIQTAQRDTTYIARAAALAGLAKYGPIVATPVLKTALADRDWAVRVRAAMLLKEIDPAAAADVDAQIRPAPTTVPPETYTTAQVTTPPVSTQLYIDTDRGTIQIELAVLDAPLTVREFRHARQARLLQRPRIHRVVPNFVIQDGDPRATAKADRATRSATS